MISIWIRRRPAVGGTLVELTVVLVILGILVLTQLNSGLGALEKVRRLTASLHTPPATVQFSPHGTRPDMTAPVLPTPQAVPLAAAPERPLREKVAGALHRAADWLEKPSPRDPAAARREEERKWVCVGRLCV